MQVAHWMLVGHLSASHVTTSRWPTRSRMKMFSLKETRRCCRRRWLLSSSSRLRTQFRYGCTPAAAVPLALALRLTRKLVECWGCREKLFVRLTTCEIQPSTVAVLVAVRFAVWSLLFCDWLQILEARDSNDRPVIACSSAGGKWCTSDFFWEMGARKFLNPPSSLTGEDDEVMMKQWSTPINESDAMADVEMCE